MGHFLYYPKRNPRAYTTELLASRLRLLLAVRQLPKAIPSAARWAETLVLCHELHRREAEPILVTDAIAMGPERAKAA